MFSNPSSVPFRLRRLGSPGSRFPRTVRHGAFNGPATHKSSSYTTATTTTTTTTTRPSPIVAQLSPKNHQERRARGTRVFRGCRAGRFGSCSSGPSPSHTSYYRTVLCDRARVRPGRRHPSPAVLNIFHIIIDYTCRRIACNSTFTPTPLTFLLVFSSPPNSPPHRQ